MAPWKPACRRCMSGFSETWLGRNKARALAYLLAGNKGSPHPSLSSCVLEESFTGRVQRKRFRLAVNGEPGRSDTLREYFRSLFLGCFPTEPAAALSCKHLAASERQHLENWLEPEGRRLVGLLHNRFTRLARRILFRPVFHAAHSSSG